MKPRNFIIICEAVKNVFVNKGIFDHSLMNEIDLKNENMEIDDARACFGAIHYIISNAQMYNVTKEILFIELEQSGLPNEHCKHLCSVYEEIIE